MTLEDIDATIADLLACCERNFTCEFRSVFDRCATCRGAQLIGELVDTIVWESAEAAS